jgi:hypothetical protein
VQLGLGEDLRSLPLCEATVELVGRILKRRIAAFALTLGLIVGGAIAAVAASGTDAGSSAPARTAKHKPQLLQTAADYLGVSREQLKGELRSGQTLAQIAAAAGKPEAGLQQALGQVASSKIEQRANSTPTTRKAHRAGRHRRSLRAAAATYLGLTPSELTQQLREGASLAQIAERTSGHSAQGLIDALVQVRLAGSSKPGTADKPAAGPARLAKLRAHVKAFVEKAHGTRHQTSRTATQTTPQTSH